MEKGQAERLGALGAAANALGCSLISLGCIGIPLLFLGLIVIFGVLQSIGLGGNVGVAVAMVILTGIVGGGIWLFLQAARGRSQ